MSPPPIPKVLILPFPSAKPSTCISVCCNYVCLHMRVHLHPSRHPHQMQYNTSTGQNQQVETPFCFWLPQQTPPCQYPNAKSPAGNQFSTNKQPFAHCKRSPQKERTYVYLSVVSILHIIHRRYVFYPTGNGHLPASILTNISHRKLAHYELVLISTAVTHATTKLPAIHQIQAPRSARHPSPIASAYLASGVLLSNPRQFRRRRSIQFWSRAPLIELSTRTIASQQRNI